MSDTKPGQPCTFIIIYHASSKMTGCTNQYLKMAKVRFQYFLKRPWKYQIKEIKKVLPAQCDGVWWGGVGDKRIIAGYSLFVGGAMPIKIVRPKPILFFISLQGGCQTLTNSGIGLFTQINYISLLNIFWILRKTIHINRLPIHVII